MTEAKRSTSDSLCAQPCSRPRAFHWYFDTATSVHVRQELVALAWSLGLSVHDAAGLVGDVEAKMKRAARGLLRSAEDLVPVRLHPTLWELRWSLSVGEFRLYHAEPGTRPEMVALRFHQKDTTRSRRTRSTRCKRRRWTSHRIGTGGG